MPEGPMPEQGQGDQGQQSGGGIADAFVKLDKGLLTISKVVAENPSIPDEAKQLLQAAHESYRQALEIINDVAGGGGGGGQGGGAVSPEQGASKGAVPMTMGRPA